MRRLSLIAFAFILAACSTSSPVRTEDGNWMISARVPFSGQTGAIDQALDAANSLCASKGQVVQLVSDTSKECALHGGCGEAEIKFKCVNASN